MSTLNWQKSIKKYIEDIVIITAIPTGMPLVAANIEPLKSFAADFLKCYFFQLFSCYHEDCCHYSNLSVHSQILLLKTLPMSQMPCSL